MNRITSFLIVVALLFFSSTCMASEFDMYKKNATVQPFVQSAYGYVFFPKIGQGGFIIGGSYGKGEIYEMGKLRGTVEIVKTSFGLQAGGGSYSELIFFQNKHAYDEFIAGRMDFSFSVSAVGAGASTAATTGSKGELATTSVDRNAGNQKVKGYQNGIRVFVHVTGGLQVGASVANQKVKFTPTVE